MYQFKKLQTVTSKKQIKSVFRLKCEYHWNQYSYHHTHQSFESIMSWYSYIHWQIPYSLGRGFFQKKIGGELLREVHFRDVTLISPFISSPLHCILYLWINLWVMKRSAWFLIVERGNSCLLRFIGIQMNQEAFLSNCLVSW